MPILTTPNDGYNCLPESHHAHQDGQTTGLTPEPIKYTSTLENTPRVKPQLRKLDIYDYETCIPPPQSDRSHTLQSDELEGAGPYVDDIPTWQNPGYNCPRDHITGQEGSSRATHQQHQRRTAPTPEHESFTSVWQQPSQSKDGTSDQQLKSTQAAGSEGTVSEGRDTGDTDTLTTVTKVPDETLNSELANASLTETPV